MTTYNNYDQSSTGINIEFNVFIDYELSHMLFEDEIERIDDRIFQYDAGFEDFEPSYVFKPSLTFKEILLNIVGLFYTYVNTTTYMDFKESYFPDTHWRDLGYDDLREFLEEHITNDYYSHEILEAQLDIDFINCNYNTVEIQGYSQSDYATVIIPSELETNKTSEYLSRIFYDAPLGGTISIHGDEYDIGELLEDTYEWDKDALIDKLVSTLPDNYFDEQQVDYIVDTLEDNLPDQVWA